MVTEITKLEKLSAAYKTAGAKREAKFSSPSLEVSLGELSSTHEAVNNAAYALADEISTSLPLLITALREEGEKNAKLEDMVGAAYQFAGNVLDYAGLFGHDEGQRALDYFCGNTEQEFFQWPSSELPPNMEAMKARAEAAEAEVKRLKKSLVDTAAALVAAHSLLSRADRDASKHVGSYTMFRVMLNDYLRAIKNARQTLGGDQ